MNRLKLGGLILVVLLLIVFLLQNQSSVTIRFLFFSITIPQSILFAVLLLAGIVIGMYLGQRIQSKQGKNK